MKGIKQIKEIKIDFNHISKIFNFTYMEVRFE